ncbi:heme ABC transporter ATP-binding protein [Glutamicibacter arilaitensis]|uniref:Heme ABC transporter ATP-binding protein n=1 Tax=Glutamicibacter arilaitensis TaxID=256701 RepID=A0A4Y8TT17_9MICC|nr:heme ABC transporter ATP-binding protein [Glutamicibacter arilaitensis]TFH54579.1 heme ABC transporter ATP-binding protein [Glutamicibacter arilaitensis]
MSATPVIQVRGAQVQLGGAPILKEIDLELFTGEVVALVGPNGAGKSTLLAALSGDEPLESGQIMVAGKPLESWSVRQLSRVRAVQTQESRVSFAFTGEEVVRMGRAPWVGTEQEYRDDQVLAAALRCTESQALASRTVQTLSGGEKARIAFARVMAQETRIIMLDEPTAPMDIRYQEQLMTMVRQRARDGATAVVVLHDLSLAAAYADRIVLLQDGRVAAAGAPDEVLTAENLQRVYRYPLSVMRHPENGALVITPLRPHLQPISIREKELI